MAVVPFPAHMDRIRVFKDLDQLHSFLATNNLLLTHVGPLKFVRGIGLPSIPFLGLLRILVHFCGICF